jgi:hypothetical protein
MCSEISRLIKDHDGTFWNHSVNHQRCFCHFLALILGAGLTAIKLSTAEGPTVQRPESFPTLPTITKDGELLQDAQASDDVEDIDPDDLSTDSESESDPKENSSLSSTTKNKGKYADSGIGFTLKKACLLGLFLSSLLSHCNPEC